MSTCLHVYIDPYMHAYIHTDRHTYIHTHLYIYIHIFMYVQIPGSKYPLRKCLATWFSLYVYVFNIPRKKKHRTEQAYDCCVFLGI